MSVLITKIQLNRLNYNAIANRNGGAIDHLPVVKLFTPDAGCTWLLTEIDPSDPDIAFGLCDLGLGYPELGYVSIVELKAIRGKFGLPVEVDRHFTADKTISKYADIASTDGYIFT